MNYLRFVAFDNIFNTEVSWRRTKRFINICHSCWFWSGFHTKCGSSLSSYEWSKPVGNILLLRPSVLDLLAIVAILALLTIFSFPSVLAKVPVMKMIFRLDKSIDSLGIITLKNPKSHRGTLCYVLSKAW